MPCSAVEKLGLVVKDETPQPLLQSLPSTVAYPGRTSDLCLLVVYYVHRNVPGINIACANRSDRNRGTCCQNSVQGFRPPEVGGGDEVSSLKTLSTIFICYLFDDYYHYY